MMTTDMGADELKPALSKMFGDNRKLWPTTYVKYMTKMNSTEFFEEFTQSGGFQDVPLLDEGDLINVSKPDLGDKYRLQPERRQLAFAITQLDKKFNKVDKVARAMKKLSIACGRTTERVAAAVFNYGFNSTMRPMTDGQPLFSTAHIRLNGATASNRPGTDVDLSMPSLEDAITNFRLLIDQDGTPINISPKYLLVHPYNEINAKRILRSQNYFTNGAGTDPNPGAPNAAYLGVANVASEYQLEIIVNPFLTSPEAWFLLGSQDDTELKMVENEPCTDRSFQDPWTEDTIYSISFANIGGAISDIAAYGTLGS